MVYLGRVESRRALWAGWRRPLKRWRTERVLGCGADPQDGDHSGQSERSDQPDEVDGQESEPVRLTGAMTVGYEKGDNNNDDR